MNQAIVFLVIISILVSGCASNNATDPVPNQTIVTTFYPIHELTSRIAGDKMNVVSIVPQSVEPHDYEPTPQQVVRLSGASAFVTIGLEFEPIEERLIANAKSAKVIDVKKGVNLIENEEVVHEEEHEEIDEDHHEGADPHIWLSPRRMIIMAENIQEGLSQINPENAEIYDANAANLVAELQVLDAEFSSNLQECTTRTILTSHRAFSYLASDYDLEQVAISGLSPESEPTPQEIIKIKEEAESLGIKYLFTESLVDQRVAKVLADEIGAQTLVLDPIEGVKNPGDNYFTLMRKNLENLKVGLGCN